jgi:hypothetical protein
MGRQEDFTFTTREEFLMKSGRTSNVPQFCLLAEFEKAQGAKSAFSIYVNSNAITKSTPYGDLSLMRKSLTYEELLNV